jgi:O-antigen ligase
VSRPTPALSDAGMAPLVQAGLYLLVASIPFEYPERSIPLEIPTLTGAVFLLTTLFHPRACYTRVPAAVLWFAAYLVVFLLSITASGSEYAPEALGEFVVVFQGVLVLLAAGNLMQDDKVARRSMVILVTACAVRAALPFLGFAKTAAVVWTGGERVSALGQNANSAAMILAAGLVALIGLTFIRRNRSRLRFLITGLLGALLGFAVLETGSRGGLASLLGGMLVFALAAGSLRVLLRNGAIAVLAISLLTFATLRLPVMKNRLEDSMKTGNMAGREQLYPALWTMFLERPILGWGPVTNTYELAQRIGERERPHRAAHNIVLELLTATGLVGTIPFLVGAWLCVRGAWQARRGEHGVLPLALFASVLIANMSGDWIASKLVWLVLAYALASGWWRAPAARLLRDLDQAGGWLPVNGRGTLAGALSATLRLPLGEER